MRRLFIIATLAGVVALTVLSATGQPGPGPQDSRHAQRRSRMGPRWFRDFEERLDEDLQWLRDNGLEKYADKLAQLRQRPHTPQKRRALIEAIRKVRQLRILHDARPKQARWAIEALRLEPEIERLTDEWLKADRAGDKVQRRQIGQQLRKTLEKQFDARLESQRALIEIIKARLEKHQKDFKKLAQRRDLLIDERFRNLTQPGPTRERAADEARDQ
ncbi:MAG: hypothetical protein GWP05_09505 [Anaerolineaceae bacterium]|nr:hypothetical protein [Anaerolineaceae bacterium]